jgi:lipoyl(octanoyl) transferase
MNWQNQTHRPARRLTNRIPNDKLSYKERAAIVRAGRLERHMTSRETLTSSLFVESGAPVEWRRASAIVPYEEAVAEMERIVAAIAEGHSAERVWLLEHSPLYTAGTSAKPQDLVADDLPVHWTGRGGQFTYHGPGQRVAYVMLDLKRRQPDLRAFVAALETWLIATLDAFGIKAGRREDRVGVWVLRPDKPAGPDGTPAEDKIAALGIRVRRWVSFHGISLNVAPNLDHFSGIVPCGIAAPHYGVTSLHDLGVDVTMEEVDAELRRAFGTVFGPSFETPLRGSSG